MATRPNNSSPFGAPALAPIINSDFSEAGPDIKGDGCIIAFSSDRDAPLAQADIWLADSSLPACLPEIVVSIDIKPGSFPNSINLGSGGSVPVAILSSDSFDATTVDPLTITLAGATVKLKGKGTPSASFQDVNGDGRLDLVVHVQTDTLQLTETDTIATLEGKTGNAGRRIRGSDSVRIVP
jgi:hypothetical protein